jgi:MtN3 and saliva related transmembrane protein
MDSSLIQVVGSFGAICTTAAFVPQVLQIWRTRSAKDVSLPMYIIFTMGVVSWLAYGIAMVAWPIIIANIVTLGLASAVIFMKLRFD